MIYDLPTSLEVNGKKHPIRTDFRDVMRIIIAMNDPNLSEKEKAFICLYVLFEDFEDIDVEDYEAAFKVASIFIDLGEEKKSLPKSKKTKPIMDFEQDERLLIAAVNRVAGTEVRALDYLHWWTFMGYFMEIGECTYSTVLSLRKKKNEGKALEGWEKEYWDSNKSICVLKEKLSDEDEERKELLNKLLG